MLQPNQMRMKRKNSHSNIRMAVKVVLKKEK
jgi:hypothetical protein